MDVGGDARGDLPAPDSWKILGGLRFALAMIVLFGHLVRFVPDQGPINKGLLLFGGLGAAAAVFCFLVISGYSIAHSITVPKRLFPAADDPDLSALCSRHPSCVVAIPVHGIADSRARRRLSFPEPSTIAGNLLLL